MRSALPRMVLSRILENLREPEAIFWTFVFPALLAVALGVAFRGGKPEPTPTAVAEGPGAEGVARALASDRSLDVALLPRAAAEERLRTGRVLVLVLPGDPVLYRFDPSRPEARLARATADAALQRAAGRRDPVPVADRPVRERGSRYIDFLVPGLLGMNLMGSGVWGIGYAVVEMRIRKLLKLQLTTPMRRSEFLMAQVLTRLLYVPLEMVPLLLLSRWLFDVRIAGPVAVLAAVAVLGALSFAGIGTLLASRARTNSVIMGLINLVTLPMFVLSGVFFSNSRFPDPLQPLIRLLPLTALVDALRSVMNEGASVPALGFPLLVLSAWGAVSFLLALRLFRWT